MNCALGISQMKRIDAMLARRAEIAGKYHDKLRELKISGYRHWNCRGAN